MISRRTHLTLAAALAASMILAADPAARAASDEQSTVNHALGTLQDLEGDKELETRSSCCAGRAPCLSLHGYSRPVSSSAARADRRC